MRNNTDRLKDRRPTALLTVEDLVPVYKMAESDSDLEVDGNSDWV